MVLSSGRPQAIGAFTRETGQAPENGNLFLSSIQQAMPWLPQLHTREQTVWWMSHHVLGRLVQTFACASAGSTWSSSACRRSASSRSMMMHITDMPGVYQAAMGIEMYLTRHADLERMHEDVRFVQATQ